MIKVLLLSATLLLVNSAPRKHHLILEDVIKELNTSIPEDLQNTWVPDLFETGKCSKEYFCQAQAALKEVKHHFMQKWNIIRALLAYHKILECPTNETRVGLQLKDFLTKVRHCAQQLYAKP